MKRIDAPTPADESTSAVHVSVLLDETIERLAPRNGGRYVDCTVGAGGHAAAILARSAPSGTLLGLDADAEILPIARERLARFGRRATLVQANFAELGEVARRHGFDGADGVLFDLGV